MSDASGSGAAGGNGRPVSNGTAPPGASAVHRELIVVTYHRSPTLADTLAPADTPVPADDVRATEGAAPADAVVRFFLSPDDGGATAPRTISAVEVPADVFAQVAAEFAAELERALAAGLVPQASIDEWRATCRSRRAGHIAQFLMSVPCFAQTAVILDEELNALVARGAIPQATADQLRAASRQRRGEPDGTVRR